MEENKQLIDFDKYDLSNFRHLREHGLEAVKGCFLDDLKEVLKLFHNPGGESPDANMETPADLVEIANLIPQKYELPELWSYPPNMQRQITVLSADVFEEFRRTQNLKLILLEGYEPLETSESDKYKSIDEQYEMIRHYPVDFSDILFSHIQPVDSVERKTEAVRVYESVRQIRDLINFFYDLQDSFYEYRKNLAQIGKVKKIKADGKEEFSINNLAIFPVNIYFERMIDGIINANGLLIIEEKNSVINKLDITKIQKCAVCEKFIWVASGKTNVPRTCSDEHAKLLKKKKSKLTYDKSPALFIVNRTYKEEKMKKAGAQFQETGLLHGFEFQRLFQQEQI